MDNAIEVKKVRPKDVFLHLLAILTLYGSATAFLVIIFQYINIYFPDPITSGYYYLETARSAIRWSISVLIIVFPVYLLTSWFLNKNYSIEPEKRNLRVRKWLIYFTIFVAALIIIGDLVTLIYNLLGGELTTRFLLKVAAVFFVSASVFFYYFSDLRKYKIE